MTKSDEAFTEALERSKIAVARVADWLTAAGHDIEVPDTVVRPTFADRMNFADAGDILITKRIEVKHRNLDFTSADDFPYPTISFDEVYKVKRAGTLTLCAYVVLNRALTHCAVIYPKTRDRWLEEDRYDRTNRDRRLFYACPVGLAEFWKLTG